MSPDEWIAGTSVTLIPAASTVPPWFIPMRLSLWAKLRFSQSCISCMHGQVARVRLPTMRASPKWSKCPWVTRRTSACVTWSADFGLFGFENHGSMITVFPPGVRISTTEWPYQVMVVSRPSGIGESSFDRLLRPWSIIAPKGRRRRADTLTAVPAERIAANLAFINWTVLTGLAVGSFAAVVLARMRTDATRGFLAFTAACAVALGVLALLSDMGLPTAVEGGPVAADPAWDVPRRAALIAFLLLASAMVIALASRRRASRLGLAGLLAGVATLLLGAATWGGGALS